MNGMVIGAHFDRFVSVLSSNCKYRPSVVCTNVACCRMQLMQCTLSRTCVQMHTDMHTFRHIELGPLCMVRDVPCVLYISLTGAMEDPNRAKSSYIRPSAGHSCHNNDVMLSGLSHPGRLQLQIEQRSGSEHMALWKNNVILKLYTYLTARIATLGFNATAHTSRDT